MPKVATKLDCYEFGRQLLESRDLDPVYVLLHGAEDYFSPDDLQAWLLAYWCFYHVGTASWIMDEELTGSGHSYWEGMMEAAKSKEYPRSAERRHFRGQNAIKSVGYLESRGLSCLFDPLLDGPAPLKEILDEVQEWEGFGPWISFKVADMLERLGLVEIDFSDCDLYDSPKEGALKLYETELLAGEANLPDKDDPRMKHKTPVVTWAMDRILEELGKHPAPPRYERDINYQEAETILCKWKSYLNGKYHVGEDIAACRRALLRFSRSRTAQRLLLAGKDADLWK